MTDISISNIDRISHKDLDRKIEQLSYYIKRVNQRIDAINNFASNSTAHQKKVSQELKKKSGTKSSIRIKR